jgi:homospermidine synthase
MKNSYPSFAFEHPDGPKSQICLARMGMNTFVASWVPPDHNIVGMVVRHGEAFSITEKLTVWEEGKAIYRPTVHYAYCPCDCAIASLHELRGYDYRLQAAHAHHDRRNHQRGRHSGRPGDGASVPVVVVRLRPRHRGVASPGAAPERHHHAAISVVAACMWMLEHPRRGLCVPDDLPHDYVLDISKPYLGKFISVASDWNPLKHYSNVFRGYNQPQLDTSDPWQFTNFLITEGD